LKANKILFQVVLIACVLLVSFLLYLPVLLAEDDVGRGYATLYNYGLNIILILVSIVVVSKKVEGKPLYSLIMIIMIVIAVYTPMTIHTEYEKWKQYQIYNQPLTAEDIKIKWFGHPSGFRTPMRDISINMENGHVHLKMEYDEQAALRYKSNDDRSTFQRDLLGLISYYVFSMSPYNELKTLTVQVRYKNEWYEFDQIPLKDMRNQPFTIENNDVKSIVSDKMKIEGN
jgi:hypothetical protein